MHHVIKPKRPAPRPPVRGMNMGRNAQQALINAFKKYVNNMPTTKRRVATLKNLAKIKRIKNKLPGGNIRENFENWAKNKNLNRYKNNKNIISSFMNSEKHFVPVATFH